MWLWLNYSVTVLADIDFFVSDFFILLLIIASSNASAGNDRV